MVTSHSQRGHRKFDVVIKISRSLGEVSKKNISVIMTKNISIKDAVIKTNHNQGRSK